MNNYEKSIFINCPFDAQYSPLFEALLFTLLICGFQPHCALEVNDGNNRLEKIFDIMDKCKFAFHDLSRTELDRDNNLPRFNMPLELGMFLGIREYGSTRNKGRVAVVFDKEKFRYQKFISDISGIDIEAHENKPEKLIINLRKVLNTNTSKGLKGHDFIIGQYKLYEKKKNQIIKNLELDDSLEYKDQVKIMTKFLNFVSSSATAET